MKIFRYFFVLIMAISMTTFTYASLLTISEQQINHYLGTELAEKVKLQDDVGIPGLFQLNYQINHLQTRIGQTDDKRVEIIGNADTVLKLKNREYQVKITLNMDTVPYYDSEKGALFLKDVRLTHWQMRSSTLVINYLINKYFSNKSFNLYY